MNAYRRGNAMAEQARFTNLVGVGEDTFETLIRSGGYYVDKTLLVRDLLRNRSRVNLFHRPRRFGKTMNMSMLRSFLEIGADKSLFQGLAIKNETTIWDKHMGQYPVISISLKGIEAETFTEALSQIQNIVSTECKRIGFLNESEKTDSDDKDNFALLKAEKASQSSLRNSLAILARMLRMHYGKRVVILIDEYDVPLNYARNRYQDSMLIFMRGFLGDVFKTNEDVEFIVVTGCLRFAKESIFTGANNPVVDTVLDSGFSSYFGFTDQEVEHILTDFGLSRKKKLVGEWYDGYLFGRDRIYNPWDVMSYCLSILKDPETEPQSYWINSSSNDIIRELIEKSKRTTKREIEELMKGHSLRKKILRSISYDDFSNTDSLWSVLLMSGYLTCSKEKVQGIDVYNLLIPNMEVREIYVSKITEWFRIECREVDFSILLDAFWKGNSKIIEESLVKRMIHTISYYDYKEDYYHGFLAELLDAGSSYDVKSNDEMGLGRSDIAMIDDQNDRCILIEIKHSDEKSDMETDCKEALNQIIKQQYAVDMLNMGFSVIPYGIAFFKKSCMVVTGDMLIK